MGFLRIVPPFVWAGMGAAILAALVSYGVIMYNKGVTAGDLKWVKSVLGWEAKQAQTNVEIDRVTYKRDADVLRRIEGAKTKWQAGSQ